MTDHFRQAASRRDVRQAARARLRRSTRAEIDDQIADMEAEEAFQVRRYHRARIRDIAEAIRALEAERRMHLAALWEWL